MPKEKEHLEELLAFIKENRSNEINFEKLNTKLKEEIEAKTNQNMSSSEYYKSLNEIIEKQALEYKSAKEKTGTAWPEYGKFVSHFELAITSALNSKD